jgi:hypothetical protein
LKSLLIVSDVNRHQKMVEVLLKFPNKKIMDILYS